MESFSHLALVTFRYVLNHHHHLDKTITSIRIEWVCKLNDDLCMEEAVDELLESDIEDQDEE